MLIKAPIGSGKSFLFFDGPIYGLYKYSSRNILNNKSKSGYIKIICEINSTLYFIKRTIKKGKSKDSCESKIFTLEGNLPHLEQYEPLEKNIDIEDIIKKNSHIKREEIVFKNETDLQQNLQTFLPPKEVIMNTIFLMQDSDNIFELSPIERLTILKNVFNLMGIDEAKEILAEKKREIRYKIKSKTDISKYNEKLKSNIQNYLLLFDTTKKLLQNDIDTKSYEQFFNEWRLIQEKIQITDFSLNEFPTEWESNLNGYIEQKKIEEQKINHQIETIKNEIKKNQKKGEELQTIKNELSKNIYDLQKKIENINEKKINILKEQKQQIIEQQIAREKKIPKEKIRGFIQNNINIIETDIQKYGDIGILTGYGYIQNLIHQGKKLDEEIKNIQLQIKNQQLIITNEKEKITTQKQHLKEKIQDQNNQLKKIIEMINEGEKNIETQTKFSCERINEQCPFIKIINKKTLQQLEQQKATLYNQKNQIESFIIKLQTELQKLNSTIIEHDETIIEKLEIQKKNKEHLLEIIKKFLYDIDYKSIEILYNEYIEQEKYLKIIEKNINDQEGNIKNIEQRKILLQKYITQNESIENQFKELTNIQKEQEKILYTLQIQQQNNKNTTTITLEKNYHTLQQYHYNIKTIIHEFKEHQIEKQKLEEQEKILENLYTIFSKELLLIILQDHLPIINDIINNYLTQIVDYQITLQLNKNNIEKIELEAKIIDQKGIRDIKSLSGGQRIILKLVRMLAISSYINSPILFLDETINNLDEETVSKVANMLEDFVKQKNIKLYIITHNQQIQQMDIRDKIIEIA